MKSRYTWLLFSILLISLPVPALAAYTQEQKIVAPDGAAGDGLGTINSAISDAGDRIAIAAPYSFGNTGSIYIYSRSGTTWTFEQELKGTDYSPGGSYFGYTTTMSPLGDRIAASGTDDVIIFSRSGTTWTKEQTIQPSDMVPGDDFGNALDFSSDSSRLIATSDQATVNGHARQGTGYIFTRSGTTWTQEAKIFAADGTASNFFGAGIHAADISEDGTRAIVVGNYNGQTSYIFSRSGTTWTQEQKLTDAAATRTRSVAISGDGSQAAIGHDNGTTGMVSIYSRSGNTWTWEQDVVGSDSVVGSGFGYIVLLDSGGSRLVVMGWDPNMGHDYVFTRSGATWTQQQELKGSDTTTSSEFGYGVSMTGDGSRIFAGESYATISGHANQGAAYVFFDASLAATPTPASKPACHPEISSCLGRYATPTPTPTPSPESTPVQSVSPVPSVSLSPTPLPSSPTLPSLFNLSEGDTIRATGDNDIFIINSSGFKRLFVNPEIFNLYGHLGWDKVKTVSPSVRDSFITSGLFRNCETNDPKVYALSLDSPDSATLHWLNVSADSALSSDPSFFSKVFCINTKEENLYSQGLPYTSYSEIPKW